MAQRTATKLNLFQCKRLVANGFLTKDNQHDYQAEEVTERLWRLQSKRDEQYLKTLMKIQSRGSSELISDSDLPPPIPAECCEGCDAQYDWLDDIDLIF